MYHFQPYFQSLHLYFSNFRKKATCGFSPAAKPTKMLLLPTLLTILSSSYSISAQFDDFNLITESKPKISAGLLSFDSFSNGLSNSNLPTNRNNMQSYKINQDKFLPLEGEVFKADSAETALDLATRAEQYFRPKFLAHPVSRGF